MTEAVVQASRSIVPSPKINLFDLDPDGLEHFFVELGEKPFRARQFMKWVYHRDCLDFDGMTDMSKALRTRIAERGEWRLPAIVDRRQSKDGTCKWLLQVDGGSRIEMVYIPDGDRGTLCVSSQVGCALDCSFCSTGKQGYHRDLSTGEIIGQVYLADRELRTDHSTTRARPRHTEDRPVTNVVLMGMGEPLLNFDAAVEATNLMMHDLGFGISKRRVTISTAGLVPAIDRLGAVSDVSLAVSLHAPFDELRNELVPINRKYPIRMLLDACRRYQDGLGEHRVVTFEYTLIDGVNDTLECANGLVELLRDFPCKLNLIPFNPFPGSGYRRPSGMRVLKFQRVMIDAGVSTMIRTTRGEDIDAACGQLAGEVRDRTRRQERYLARLSMNTAAS